MLMLCKSVFKGLIGGVKLEILSPWERSDRSRVGLLSVSACKYSELETMRWMELILLESSVWYLGLASYADEHGGGEVIFWLLSFLGTNRFWMMIGL